MGRVLRLLVAVLLLTFASVSNGGTIHSFTQDTFFIESQATLVELFDIDAAASTFMVRTSGWVSNGPQSPDEIYYKDYQTVDIVALDDDVLAAIGLSYTGPIDSEFGLSPVGGSFVNPDAILGVTLPVVSEGFNWSATFQLTVADLEGEYSLRGQMANLQCDPECDGEGWDSPESFTFGIVAVPEPSAAILFSFGGAIILGSMRPPRAPRRGST